MVTRSPARRSTSARSSPTGPRTRTSQVRIPLAMINRHGLVAGATGTGKTKTLQLMAEQLSRSRRAGVPRRHQGRPVRDGDAGGAERQDRRARQPTSASTGCRPSYPTEFYCLGGQGTGIPIRATVTSFGPMLLSQGARAQRRRRSRRSAWSSTTPTRPACRCSTSRTCARSSRTSVATTAGRARRARRPVQGDGRRDPARADRVRGPGRRRVLRRAGVRHPRAAAHGRRRPRHGVGPRAARRCRTGRRCSRRS